MPDLDNRRPIRSRGSGWAKTVAARLAEADTNPNLISAASFAVSALGGALLMAAGVLDIPGLRAACLIGAALMIQARLVCNLIDGMVAVEGRQGSTSGPIWNELPDRFSDAVLLAAAGYSASASGIIGGSEMGWICAVLALICAYVRELGRGLGFPADFSGPMAKPQRMAVLTGAALVSIFEPLWRWSGQIMMIALVVIALGLLITIARRVRTLARRLADKAQGGGET